MENARIHGNETVETESLIVFERKDNHSRKILEKVREDTILRK